MNAPRGRVIREVAMARIVDATLSVTRDRTGDHATVSGHVEFSPGEIRLGLSYGVHIFIAEVDQGLDRYTLDINGFLQPLFISYDRSVGEGQPDGVTRVARMGDTDEAVLNVGGAVIAPSASGTVPFSVSVPIAPGGPREDGNEEYQAVAWVVPEVCMGMRRTNQVSINLA
jgi:hypothetical protein